MPRAARPAAAAAAALAVGATALGPAVWAGAPAQAAPPWCDSARRQVVEWSLQNAAGRSRPHVTAIKHLRTLVDRVIASVDDGVVLRCLGRATLSNGVNTRVVYGFRAIDGRWYLFLKRAHVG